MLERLEKITTYIKNRTNLEPEIGIILGTGLGGLASEIKVVEEIPYGNIPDFPVSTVESHKGKMIFGTLGNKKVIAMQGRFHYYEGYTMQEVTLPVRVMKLLGIKHLLVSNASGGLNPDFEVGNLMIINDHINLFPDNPLIGNNLIQFGDRFPDMFEVYNPTLIKKAKEIALENEIEIKEGVYVGLTGPNLETPAEYKYLRIIGGDAVGMSTIPEIIVARHMKIPTFAISIITDLGIEGKIEKVDVAKIIATAKEKEPKLSLIIKKLIERI